MKKIITGKDVMRQLKADLIGKDSYRGVTLTYTWLANQFGHFSLGFIFTLILSLCLRKHYPLPKAALLSGLFIALGWLVFEVFNFLGPLLANKRSKPDLAFLKSLKYTFPPAWANVAFDTATDVGFFSLGAFSASLFLFPSCLVCFILSGLFLLLILPSRYWFLTKMYIQIAQYPFQFRLSQWTFSIDEKDKKTVSDFLIDKKKKQHLFVFGGLNSGKTSLSVGLATEFSIKHETCIYTTGMKLYSMFFTPNARLLPDTKYLWNWRNASLLVIDDVNPGSPVKDDLVTPAQFLSMLDRLDVHIPNTRNRDALKNKNVIWVMGNESAKFYSAWKKMLQDVGVAPEDIYLINL